jgi:hypothetical protein
MIDNDLSHTEHYRLIGGKKQVLPNKNRPH